MRTGPVIAVALAALVVWLASGELAGPVRAWTTFLLALLPALATFQARFEDEARELPRLALYASSAFGIWALAALTALVAWAGGRGPADLGLVGLSPAAMAGWSLGALAAGAAVQATWRQLGARETPLLEHLLPRTAPERIAFAGLSLSAGIGEELVFRGFLIPALHDATGSLWAAALLASGAFGVLHAYQSASGAARAALLGLVLAVPFVLTGSVVPSMLAHAAIDLVAGLWLADWLLRR